MIKFKEFCSIIEQLEEDRQSDDEYFKSQGWDGDPTTRFIYVDSYKKKKATTQWTTLAAIEDVLGKDMVIKWDNMRPPKLKQLQPNKVYVMLYHIVGSISFIPQLDYLKKTGQLCGIISVRSLVSRNADDVSMAVHEAYHAKLWFKVKGQGNFYGNEKVVNDLAEKWLKKNIRGFNVQVGMDKIGTSRAGYGVNKAPYVTPWHGTKGMSKADIHGLSYEDELMDKLAKKQARINQGLPLSPTNRFNANP
jgi:hypothetical protein